MQTIIRPSLDNKPYRLKCRFKIEPYPRLDRLAREKVRLAERFVDDMHKQGWEYDSRWGFKMHGPFPPVTPISLRTPPPLRARDMLNGIARGERYLDEERSSVSIVPPLAMSEWWEYELSGVFIRQQIQTEVPDLHEEIT